MKNAHLILTNINFIFVYPKKMYIFTANGVPFSKFVLYPETSKLALIMETLFEIELRNMRNSNLVVVAFYSDNINTADEMASDTLLH